MEKFIPIFHIRTVLILIDGEFRLHSRSSNVEVVLPRQLLNIHIHPTCIEVFGLVASLLLSRVVIALSADHHVALLVGLGDTGHWILRGSETAFHY